MNIKEKIFLIFKRTLNGTPQVPFRHLLDALFISVLFEISPKTSD